MSQTAIFGPFFLMLMLTLVVWSYMYARRISFINASNLGPDEITPEALARLSPPAVSNPSDNLKNLFEMPVLFYAISLYLFGAEQVDGTYVAAGWIFAGFRVLHSAMHCTRNLVMVRFWLYFASSLALWFMAVRAMLGFLNGSG